MAHYRQNPAATEPLTSETHGERSKMSSLNDTLAHYIQNVRDMKIASARALGQSHYYESLERMENELIKIRNTYDFQMERMRKDVEATNTKNIALIQALQRDRQRLEELERRLAEDNSVIQKAKGHQGDMRQAISQREAELMRLRSELKSRDEELTNVKTKNNSLAINVDEMLRKLEIERKKRMETEDKVIQIHEATSFQKQVHNQKENDLHERIKVANSIIQSLDDKLGEVAQMTHEQLPKMLKKMRDATTTEMRQFHAETEDRLGKTIGTLKRQMAEEQRGKNLVEQEREALKKVAISQDESKKDLLGQNQALREQIQALKGELEVERERSRAKAREQQQLIHQLEEELMDKAKEFVRAREAQSILRAEIDTYKSMLLEENSRMQGNPGSLSDRGPIPVQVFTPPSQRKLPPSIDRGGIYNRHHTQSVPPDMTTQPKLPPIQGASNMTGILEPHRVDNPYLDQRNHWPNYDTTYKRSFSPKPHNKYGRT